MPQRPLTHDEARWVAERQAERLRQLTGYTDEPFLPRDAIERQPKIQIVHDDQLPHSGATHWNGRVWQITIKSTEPFARQRYTLAHEYKHVLDYPFDDYCYPVIAGHSAEQRAEHTCDYFAACLLMPKTLIRKAWTAGRTFQNVGELAQLFGVSTRAMEVRLQELGLLDARYRCRFPRTTKGRSIRFRTSAETRELLNALGAR